MRDNPITESSAEVLGDALTSYGSADIAAIRRYYEQLREAGEATFYEAKLLIIGDGGAGKTSLAQKLQEPASALKPDEASTEGVDIITWHFDLPPEHPETQYQVNIWDFGGQAVYFATHQFFLTKRSVYVLIADTRRQHTDFYTWLRMQETFGGDSPILLLKNRNRGQGNRFTIENLPQLRERFPNLKEVIELDLSDVPLAETWPDLLRELERHFMGLEHVSKPRPRTWVEVRQALQEDTRDFISKYEYLELCDRLGIKREADASQLSDYLHNLGDILHFQEDPFLVDLVILKPTWGLDAVYRVLDNPAILENVGRFALKEVRELWHEAHYEEHHYELLRLMQNFQLCYRLPGEEDTFIAPQLLGDEAPEYDWNSDDNLQLRYRYPVFMPRGMLSRAIVKLHQRIEDQRLVWRSGVVLRDKYARAELLELPGEREIRIRVAGRNKRDLLMEVVRAFDDLHRGFPKLPIERRLPCKCSTCVTRTKPNSFDLDKLREMLAYKIETVRCDEPPFKEVPIRGLLDDLPLLRREGRADGGVTYNIAGDLIRTGDIEGSSGLSFGREAQSSVN